jgi:uncharacterized repeat protein (TIGR03803 family)
MSTSRAIFFAAAAAATLSTPIANGQTFATLYSFKGGTDGEIPRAGLIQERGTLYGTTVYGGTSGQGTVFKVDLTTGAETVLYSFLGGSDAREPGAATLIYNNGTLYGTTGGGGGTGCGGGGCGAVFKVNSSTGKEKVLYGFTGGADGENPAAGVVYVGGSIYGTTYQGGASLDGTVFELTLPAGQTKWTETVLHSFTGGSDGVSPNELIYHRGTLYGTTYGGGANNFGTVFKIPVSSGVKTVLHSFNPVTFVDGGYPQGGLMDVGGILYGTTPFGGVDIDGVVYSINAATGTENTLHGFTGGVDGESPQAGVIYVAGSLYGTTPEGGGTACGGSGCGTVFKVDVKTGAKTVIYSFTGFADGSGPSTGLIYKSGAFYGTTSNGGTSGLGSVYKLTP